MILLCGSRGGWLDCDSGWGVRVPAAPQLAVHCAAKLMAHMVSPTRPAVSRMADATICKPFREHISAPSHIAGSPASGERGATLINQQPQREIIMRAVLCVGVAFDNLSELPWEDKGQGFQDGLEEWWKEINGYQEPFQLYNEYGMHLDKDTPMEKISEWYEHKESWEKNNPLPVWYQEIYEDDGEYALIIPNYRRVAGRHEFTPISPSELNPSEAEIESFLDFLAEHGIENILEPHLMLICGD